MDEYRSREQEEIFSQSIKAGRRTYFFDVKETKNKEYYLTLTESKKHFSEEGKRPHFEKHKIFLYREDFEKFKTAFQEAISFIEERQPYSPEEHKERYGAKYTDVDFDDLGKE